MTREETEWWVLIPASGYVSESFGDRPGTAGVMHCTPDGDVVEVDPTELWSAIERDELDYLNRVAARL